MKRHSQKGFGTLLSLLIAAAIIMMFVAALMPSTIRAVQATQEQSAALVLARINFAEVSARQVYLGYMNPSALAISILNPPTSLSPCNPGLLNPPDGLVNASMGYTFNWQPLPSAGSGTIATGCTLNPPQLYTGYSITAEPTSRLAGDRYFYTDTTTGFIYMNAGSPITAPDPTKIYSVNVMGGMAGVSGGNQSIGSSNPTDWGGPWTSKGYTAGTFVTYGTPPVLYLNFSGNSNSLPPNQDPYDFYPVSNTPLTQPPTLSGQIGGAGFSSSGVPVFWSALSGSNDYGLDYNGHTPPSVICQNGGSSPCPSSSPAAIVQTSAWNFSVSNLTAGETMTGTLWNENGTQMASCSVTYQAPSCSVSFSATMTPQNSYVVEVVNGGAGNGGPSVSWSIGIVQ